MDKEQAVFEQLILSDFKKWSSTAVETFNNYTIIITNNVVLKHFQNPENLISNLLKEKLHISFLASF